MDIGLLILRVVVGALFFGHGTQKLFGWFDGHGREGTAGMMDSLGYQPPGTMAVIAGATEASAGAMLVLGLLTPLAAAMIIGAMINATMAVHAENGVWNTDGGYELPLVFGAAAAALAFTGPGALAVDGAIGPFDGALYGFAAIALGVVVGVSVHSMRRDQAEPETEAPEEGRRAA